MSVSRKDDDAETSSTIEEKDNMDSDEVELCIQKKASDTSLLIANEELEMLREELNTALKALSCSNSQLEDLKERLKFKEKNLAIVELEKDLLKAEMDAQRIPEPAEKGDNGEDEATIEGTGLLDFADFEKNFQILEISLTESTSHLSIDLSVLSTTSSKDDSCSEASVVDLDVDSNNKSGPDCFVNSTVSDAKICRNCNEIRIGIIEQLY